jgi:hypothetical protein
MDVFAWTVNCRYPAFITQHLISPNHTYLFHHCIEEDIDYHDSLYGPELIDKLDEAFEKNEWIQAEIKLPYHDTFYLYFKEENNLDHIRFTDPNSISQYQPFLKKQKLFDVEDLDTELVEEELEHRMSSNGQGVLLHMPVTPNES